MARVLLPHTLYLIQRSKSVIDMKLYNGSVDGGCFKHAVKVDELLTSDWPMKYASAPNGTDEGYDGSCPCGLIHGEGFEVDIHCWRTGCQHGCQYSGIHVSGTLDESTLQKIGEYIRDNNGWTNHTDWNVTCTLTES